VSIAKNKIINITRSIILLFFNSLLYSVTLSGQAQDPSRATLDYQASLLSPNEISALVTNHGYEQDSRGNIWFVSDQGLHCHDGYKLLNYNTVDLDEIPSTTTKEAGYLGLIKTQGDSLWLIDKATQELVLFDIWRRKYIMRKSLTTHHKAVDLKKSAQGDIYLLSQMDSSYYITWINGNDDRAHYLRDGKAYRDFEIYRGHIWMTADHKLSRTSLRDYSTEYYPQEIETFSCHNDTLWSTYTLSDTIYYFDTLKNQFNIYVVPALFTSDPYEVHFHENYVWFMDKLKVLLWNRTDNTYQDYSETIQELLLLESPTSLRHQVHSPVYLRNGQVLISSVNSIILLSPIGPKLIDYQEVDLSSEDGASYRELTEDVRGNIYASYYSQLSVKSLSDSVFRTYPPVSTQRHYNHSYSLLQWRNKLLWNNQIIDTQTGDTKLILNDEMIDHMEHYLDGDTLYSINWWEMNFYLYDLATESILHENRLNINGSSIVSHMIADDKRKILWIATDQGIYAIDRFGRSSNLIARQESIKTLQQSSAYVLSISGDSLWFGCDDGLGLYDIATGSQRMFPAAYLSSGNKVVHRKIYSLLQDKDNNFLVGSSRGLCYFDTSDPGFTYLDPSHPLSEIEFNRNSAFQSSAGIYYFGGISGLYSFTRDGVAFAKALRAPPPVLNTVVIENSKKLLPKTMIHDLNDLSYLNLSNFDDGVNMNFSSTSIGKPIFYKYRMTGIKESWSDYFKDGIIEISSFPTGDYQFEIRSYFNPESEDYSSLTLDIHKAQVWHKRPWIQLLLFLAFGSLIGFAVKYRYNLIIENQKRLEALRVKISSDLHDDVGTILAGVAMNAELMAFKNFPDQKSRLADLTARCHEAMEGMRDIVWAIDSRKDSYLDLIVRMQEFVKKRLDDAEIDHSFDVRGIEGDLFIDPETRRNIYLICKEAITNICKHSDADFVQLTIIKGDSTTLFVIHDNGQSFTNLVSTSGLGLSNMKSRAREINANLTFATDDGFTVRLSV